MSKREIKKRPAGVNDNFEVTYTNFAANKERTEARVGEGHEFDNEELLKQLGFKENAQGVMSVSASSNEIAKDEKGNVVKRTANGRTLTQKRQEEAER